MFKSNLTVTALLLAGLALTSAAAPEPAPVPQPQLLPPPGVWQLDVEILEQPQRIDLMLPGFEKPRTYWYFLYRVTNHTGEEVDFYPYQEIFTDTYQKVPVGVASEGVIFELLRERYASRYPLLEPQYLVTGRMLVGEDNARDSVAIFPDFDPQARAAKIFFSGLSNETAVVKGQILEEPGEKEYLLRKTLMLEYQVPGDLENPENRVMLYRGYGWLMR